MISKKSISIILVIALVLGFINPVYVRQDEITVYFNGAITMFLDGEEFVPVETDRTYLTPVIYNGRTYLKERTITLKF